MQFKTISIAILKFDSDCIPIIYGLDIDKSQRPLNHVIVFAQSLYEEGFKIPW